MTQCHSGLADKLPKLLVVKAKAQQGFITDSDMDLKLNAAFDRENAEFNYLTSLIGRPTGFALISFLDESSKVLVNMARVLGHTKKKEAAFLSDDSAVHMDIPIICNYS